MKRLICILLALALAWSVAGCAKQEPKISDPANFYYLRIQDPENLHHGSRDSVIMPEIREVQGLRQDFAILLDLYLRGPAHTPLRSPFPRGTRLIRFTLQDRVLQLTLSDEFAVLKGLNLTLACACLTTTCLELVDADAVQITVESALLDGKTSVTLRPSDLMLTDGTITN